MVTRLAAVVSRISAAGILPLLRGRILLDFRRRFLEGIELGLDTIELVFHLLLVERV